jgi:hypothetical protein
VVVVPVLDELPPSAFVGDAADEAFEVEPVVADDAGALPDAFADAVEVGAAEPVVVGDADAPVAELVGVAEAAAAATTVCVFVAAYASARCTPRPPTARVEASSTPAVQRRVRRKATFTRRGSRLVIALSCSEGNPGNVNAEDQAHHDNAPATFAAPVSSVRSNNVTEPARVARTQGCRPSLRESLEPAPVRCGSRLEDRHRRAALVTLGCAESPSSATRCRAVTCRRS